MNFSASTKEFLESASRLQEKYFRSEIAIPTCSGALLGLAWCFPGTIFCAVAGFLSAFLLVWAALSPLISLRWIYIGGAISHVIAFSWLTQTIKKFGGFGIVPTLLIFSLFVGVSALQFFAFGFLVKILDKDLKKYCLTTPILWAVLEFLVFRLFPWGYGHTQLGFLPIVQIADIGGVLAVSFLVFWVAEACIRFFILRERSLAFWFPIVFLLFSFSYGKYQIAHFSEPEGDIQKIAVVQANVSIDDKHAQAMIVANVERYKDLSVKVPGPDTLLIWPESVITEFIPDNVGSVGNDPRIPFFPSNNPLLIGALTYNQDREIFNAALGILNSGTILDPYHKQILMPFGEFMPMSSTFPWLASLNPGIANFTPGTSEKVFEYPMIRNDDSFYTARVSPLICYEDVVSGPSRRSVEQGAELLVNITNDGWFGDTVAPYQHNLIASFRAIENRRFLVRSTNTGFTTIIAPTGKLVHSLKPFTEGTLLAEITLIRYITLYTAFVHDWFGWSLVLLVATLLLAHYSEKKT